MGDGNREERCLRVEHGRADEDELAILALLLLAARAGARRRPRAPESGVSASRWWYGLKPYTAPASWR
jgi:hypothetical protein